MRPRLARARGAAASWSSAWASWLSAPSAPAQDGLFTSVRHVSGRLAGLDHFPSVAELDARLFGDLAAADERGPSRVRLEPQRQRPRRARAPALLEDLYDVRITEAHRVPTRAGSWHDLMNALVFAAYPRAKAAVHARQASELSRHFAANGRLPNARSRLQDALALLDEGGALVVARAADAPTCRAALETGDPLELRALVRAGVARLLVFGHATLEHAVLGVPLPRAAPALLVDPAPHDGLPELAGRLDQELERHVRALDGRPGPPAIDLAALDLA